MTLLLARQWLSRWLEAHSSIKNSLATMAEQQQQPQHQEILVLGDTSSEEQDKSEFFELRIPMAPCPKPSICYGPGRKSPSGKFQQWRTYLPNPTRKKMNEFKAYVQAGAQSAGFSIIRRQLPVHVSIWCFLRRPDEDFVNRQRGAGRLKSTSVDNNTLVAIKPDTDNMAKFILDAIKGVLYEDDAQIVELHIYKLRDNIGTCEGQVAIRVGQCTRTALQMLPTF
jgi:Holliday junction resolvase RusA-like endonuclease